MVGLLVYIMIRKYFRQDLIFHHRGRGVKTRVPTEKKPSDKSDQPWDKTYLTSRKRTSTQDLNLYLKIIIMFVIDKSFSSALASVIDNLPIY